MVNFTALLLLVVAIVLQNSIVSQVQMLYGAADLVLLVLLSWILHGDDKPQIWTGVAAGFLVGVSSAIPFWLPVIGYTIIVWLISIAQRRIWQVPIWLLLISTFLGSLFSYSIEVLYLVVIGVPFDLIQVLNIVLLPSLVLNMILILPVYGLVGEIAKSVYPKEVEI